MTFADAISVDHARNCAEGSLWVDPDADFLKDHFPGAPMLPGLVMLESAVRSASALWSARHAAPAPEYVVLDRVERLHVVRRVVSGETVLLRVTPLAAGANPSTVPFVAEGTVAGDVAIRIHFRLRVLRERADRWDSTGGIGDDTRRHP